MKTAQEALKKVNNLDVDGVIKLLDRLNPNLDSNQKNQYQQQIVPQMPYMPFQQNNPMYQQPYYNQPMYYGNQQFITPNGPNMNNPPPMNFQYNPNQMNNNQQMPLPGNLNNQSGIYNSGFQPPMNNYFYGGQPPMPNPQMYNNIYGCQPLPQNQPIYNNTFYGNQYSMKNQQTDINQNQMNESQKNN